MPLIHLPSTASVQEAVAAMREHGYVIIDNLADAATMERLEMEMAPYIEATAPGQSDATGRLTKRTGALIERSPTARDLITHDLVTGVVAECLKHARSYSLSVTEVISLSPGSPAQIIHRDEHRQVTSYPFLNDYEVQISTLWAMTEYTEEMGATRVIPGSHKLDSFLSFELSDTLPAVMEKGSVMIYSGKLYHGGGHNQSDKIRRALNVDYIVGWLRQEENQYISCSREIARTLPDNLLRLMGYDAVDGLGRAYDWNDPLSVLRGNKERVVESEFASIDAQLGASRDSYS